MTNSQLINAALRLLTVLDANETASAEDGALGLSELNDLMADLSADGIEFGFPPQEDLQDNFPLDDRTASLIKPNLAMRLHAHFPSIVLPPTLVGRAADSMNRLLRDAVLENIEEADTRNIPLGESYRDRSDIING